MARKGSSPWKYDEKYCDMLIEHMKQGLSYEAFAGLIGVTRDCLYKWEKRHEEFKLAKAVGKEGSLLMWEKLGMGIVTGKLKGNASAFIFCMKNKHGWKDVIDNNVQGAEININYSRVSDKK